MSIQQPSPKVEVREFFAESAGWDEARWAEFEIQSRRDEAMARVRAKERQREDAKRKAEIAVPAAPDNPKMDPFDPRHSKSTWVNDFGEIGAVELVHHEGQVTRYDLVIAPDGTHIKRAWLAGWYPWDGCHRAVPLKNGHTIHTAADLLEAKGWKVRRGKTWARAWRCGIRPVRTDKTRRRWEERNGFIQRDLKSSLFDDRDPEE